MKDILSRLLENILTFVSDSFEEAVYWMSSGLRRGFLSWVFVRGLGELQVLTKVSYTLLVVVPLLAGTWPAVRLLVNQHNRVASDVATQLEQARVELNQSINDAQALVSTNASPSAAVARAVQPAIDRIRVATEAIATSAEDSAAQFAQRILTTVRLPWTWAAAFFAALFVSAGHFVYQLAAPIQTRSFTRDEFVHRAVDDYSSRPTESALMRAEKFMSAWRPSQRDIRETGAIFGRLEQLTGRNREQYLSSLPPKKIMRLWAVIESEYSRSFMDVDSRSPIQEELVEALSPSSSDFERFRVEYGAVAEYDLTARYRQLAILAVMALYFLGMYVILLIVRVQALSVADAAGWTSFGDLFLR